MSERTLVFIGVNHRDIGDMTLEFDSGETYNGEALVLTCLMIDADTTEKELLTLVVPKSTGFELVRNLLTTEQLDAVIESGF